MISAVLTRWLRRRAAGRVPAGLAVGLWLAVVSVAGAQPAPAQLPPLPGLPAPGVPPLAPPVAGGAGLTEKRIFVVPVRQWDSAMLSSHRVSHIGMNDLANLTGGIIFGMTPTVANAMLPDPLPGVGWNALPAATEFPEDVRYFWTRLGASSDLRAGIRSCSGNNSFAVFLFRRQGLFRFSFRFVPDAGCPDPAAAAADVFARYVPLGRNVALATHYVTGGVQVVDVTDPTANYLIPIRWENRVR